MSYVFEENSTSSYGGNTNNIAAIFKTLYGAFVVSANIAIPQLYGALGTLKNNLVVEDVIAPTSSTLMQWTPEIAEDHDSQTISMNISTELSTEQVIKVHQCANFLSRFDKLCAYPGDGEDTIIEAGDLQRSLTILIGDKGATALFRPDPDSYSLVYEIDLQVPFVSAQLDEVISAYFEDVEVA